MRGSDAYNEALFSTVRLEDFVPAQHPLRPIRQWVKDALAKMDAKFSAMYEADVKGGPPEHRAGDAHAGQWMGRAIDIAADDSKERKMDDLQDFSCNPAGVYSRYPLGLGLSRRRHKAGSKRDC
jgi:hypothetical protein